jgi:DNA-directed RNA polymerase specialized sigma24 family protein
LCEAPAGAGSRQKGSDTFFSPFVLKGYSLSSTNSDSTAEFNEWFSAVCEGDSASTSRLWEAYFERIGRSVANRLTSQGRRFEDQEDVANSVLRTFFRRASLGQFRELGDKDQLWKLLLTIAIRKANDYRKRSMAARRGGKAVVLGQDFGNGNDQLAAIDLVANTDGDLPEAELRAQELFESVMQRMPDDKTRDVVLLHLQGAEKQQIAEIQKCSIRTVERRMQNAIAIWTDAVSDPQ